MGDKSKIAWTDATWNPTTGCSKVSAGCKHCYAERQWPRLSAPGQPYEGREFTDIQCHPKRLHQPMLWLKPRRIFVNSMSDLFHESVTDEFIAAVFSVMANARWHTFQVLTKRPERALEWFRKSAKLSRAWYADSAAKYGFNFPRYEHPWPPENVWLGVSIEDQETANERIPLLLDIPATVRFLSIEPLIGPVDFHEARDSWIKKTLAWHTTPMLSSIDWVIVGGESGPKARPMHPEWVRTLRDQCAERDVPFFFKQWGEWLHVPTEEDVKSLSSPRLKYFQSMDTTFHRAGKKAAGRELDGKIHEGYPA